jgi:thiosulfate/3-mercaptopyruvate sulfurtransferase
LTSCYIGSGLIRAKGDGLRTTTGLVTAADVAQRVGDIGQNLVFIDMRQDPRSRPWVPGSAWLDLHDGFAQHRPDRGLGYDLPSPEEFASALSRAGANPESEIVIADDAGNRRATRAYWLLQYYGHQGPVSVLDGGIAAYVRAGLPTINELIGPKPGDYPPPTERDESIRATPEEILAGIEADTVCLCDVRAPEEYDGRMAMSGRGGHLPGAVHSPWEECLSADSTFLPRDQLATVLQPFISNGHQPITYCQGGIRASLTWFALQVLLERPAKLYAASWEEWAQHPELPVELPG